MKFKKQGLVILTACCLIVIIAMAVTVIETMKKRRVSAGSAENAVLAQTFVQQPPEKLAFSGSFEQTSGEKLISDLNAKGMGGSSWQVVYASDERILMRNRSSLLSFTGGVLKRAAELEPLGLNPVEGSVNTIFMVSPDGRYVLAGNRSLDEDAPPDGTGIFLIDTDTAQYAGISDSSFDRFAAAWSLNGNWLALANMQDTESIELINMKTLERNHFTIPTTTVRSLFISDSGIPAFYTGKQAVIPLSSDAAKWKVHNLDTEPLYIDADRSTVWYIRHGSCYKQRFGSKNVELKKLPGADDKGTELQIVSWRLQGEHLISLLDNGQISLISLADDTEKRFGATHEIVGDHLSWCAVAPDGGTLAWETAGSLTISDGNLEIIHDFNDAQPSDIRWMDKKRLVFIEFANANKNAGEFKIKSLSFPGGETTDIYSTVGSEPVFEPTLPNASQKVFFNNAIIKEGTLVHSEPHEASPLVEELMDYLADPANNRELNLYDEVINGFVHVENGRGGSGWVREMDFIYYNNYKNFSYEKNTLDLDSDGKSDTIEVSYTGTYHDDFCLKINDSVIDGSGMEVTDQFRIVDIDPEDPYMEVVIEEFGPSSDTMSSFYYYDGKKIHFMGKVEGLCGNRDSVAGDGKVSTLTRSKLLQTWFYKDYYELDGRHMLVHIKQDWYGTPSYMEATPLKVLVSSLSFYEAPGSSRISLTVKKDDEVFLLGSDEEKWCLFGTRDGKKGWLELTGFNTVTKLNKSADEVFAGLSYAD